MDDLEDILEAVIDVEDIVEEVLEPEDLVEDFHEEPLKILLAFVAAGAAAFTLLAALALVVLLALRIGLFGFLVGLTLLGLLVTALAVGAFLSVRSDLPHRVQRKLNRARSVARESSDRGAGAPRGADGEDPETAEERAIDELRERYAEKEITLEEFEDRLEEILGDEESEEVKYERERE